MARLVNLISGEQIELFTQHSFGRDPVLSSTHLDDSYISRSHATIFWDGEHWLLRDMSRNGTFLNGKRLNRDDNHSIAVGDKIVFGSERAPQWQLMDASHPKTMLVPKEGGEVILLYDFHTLPSEEEPQILLYSNDGRWICETESQSFVLSSGDMIGTSTQQWRFVEAIPVAETEIFERDNTKLLEELNYRFDVSQNEEHVFLRLQYNGTEFNLQERVHHYVMLELARKRIADREAGLAEAEQGWIGRKEFAIMIGLDDTNLLNIQIFRFRKQVHKVVPQNEVAANIIQSRRNEIRIMSPNIEIQGGLPV